MNKALYLDKGNIITVMVNEYIDYPGGNWSDHFAKIEKMLLVRRSPTNNGNLLAVSSSGQLYHVNTMDIIRVIK